MIRSTFAGFNTASLALSASQRALDVTGQNLSNINTQGYTRQRLDQISLSPVGPSISSSQFDSKVGQGVMMTGVSQIRDPFLDVQYRTQLPKVGTADAMDSVLAQIGQIFDETDKDAIAVQFNKIITALQNLGDPENTGTDSADTVVRSACEVLLNTIHQNGNKIQELYNELKTKLDENVVPQINKYLEEIVELNTSIKNTQVLGNPALELQDDRNELIDALATYFPIDVQYEKKHMGGGIYVDVLNINLVLTDPKGGTTKVNLISDDKRGEVGIAKETVIGKDGSETEQIVEPVEIYVTESGENPKTYGGGEAVLQDALPNEINGYIKDIQSLNQSIADNLAKIQSLQAESQTAKNNAAEASATAVNGYIEKIAKLNGDLTAAQNATPQDAKRIKELQDQRDQAIKKLNSYFPNATVTDTVEGGEKVTYVSDGAGAKYYLVKESQEGTVAAKKDANGNITDPVNFTITSAKDPGDPDKTIDVGVSASVTDAVTSASAEIEQKITNIQKRNTKMAEERDKKLKGLQEYLPGATATTDPATGIMAVSMQGGGTPPSTLQLISNANKAGTISVVTETQTIDGKDVVKTKDPLSLSINDGNNTEEIEFKGANAANADAIAGRVSGSINDMISEGVLKGDLDMLNKAEIFDKDINKDIGATDTKGIQYYQNMLDTFINKFATEMNRLNAVTKEEPVFEDDGTGNMVPVWEMKDGKPVMEPVYDVNGEPEMEPVLEDDGAGNMVPVMEDVKKTIKQPKLEEKTKTDEDGTLVTYYEPVLDADGNQVMEEVEVIEKQPKMQQKMQQKQKTETVVVKEQPLFATTDGSATFTAKNIKISDEWMSNDVKVNTMKNPQDNKHNSSDNWNVERMINALSDQKFEFVDPDSGKVFTGTLYECYTSIQRVQSVERQATSQILDTHTKVLDQISDSKDSVSGVWMDEEVMSLMKYSQSYNAASRLMTVMDEVIERLITQTGVCGR